MCRRIWRHQNKEHVLIWYLHYQHFQIIRSVSASGSASSYIWKKADMLPFHGSGNLLFICEMQQAAFVFVLLNANEHPEQKGFPIKCVWHSSNMSWYKTPLPGSSCTTISIWFMNESQNVLIKQTAWIHLSDRLCFFVWTILSFQGVMREVLRYFTTSRMEVQLHQCYLWLQIITLFGIWLEYKNTRLEGLCRHFTLTLLKLGQQCEDVWTNSFIELSMESIIKWFMSRLQKLRWL